MSGRSITSANSVLTLVASDTGVNSMVGGATGLTGLTGVSPILGVPFRMEEWAADRAFEASARDVSETVMGVDGKFSAGWLPNSVELQLSIAANSPSIEWLNIIDQVQKARRETLMIAGVLQIPSISIQYAFQNGVLKNWQPIPTHARVLEAQSVTFEFESATPSPLG